MNAGSQCSPDQARALRGSPGPCPPVEAVKAPSPPPPRPLQPPGTPAQPKPKIRQHWRKQASDWLPRHEDGRALPPTQPKLTRSKEGALSPALGVSPGRPWRPRPSPIAWPMTTAWPHQPSRASACPTTCLCCITQLLQDAQVSQCNWHSSTSRPFGRHMREKHP